MRLSSRRVRSLLPILLSFALAGCGPLDDDASAPLWVDDDDDDDDAPEYEPVWTSLYPLFEFRCACHQPNENNRGGFTGMQGEQSAYDNLVDFPSNDAPSIDRIEPGDPDASYAWLKINDRQHEVGGEGDRMPPTGNALPDRHKGVILEWIEAGAPRD